MHTFETEQKPIVSTAIFSLTSQDEKTAGIVIRTEEARTLDTSTNTWGTSKDRVKQIVSSATDGGFLELEGIVPEVDAVNIKGSVYRVVLQVQVKDQTLATRGAGQTSRSVNALSLSRVLEVWTSPSKCLYRAAEPILGAAKPGKSMDLGTGKIS